MEEWRSGGHSSTADGVGSVHPHCRMYGRLLSCPRPRAPCLHVAKMPGHDARRKEVSCSRWFTLMDGWARKAHAALRPAFPPEAHTLHHFTLPPTPIQ
eukprot:359766-Chlamydomonas_euryale.AAC.2